MVFQKVFYSPDELIPLKSLKWVIEPLFTIKEQILEQEEEIWDKRKKLFPKIYNGELIFFNSIFNSYCIKKRICHSCILDGV